MATPRYIVKKVGNDYVTEPADSYPQMTKAAYTLWGSVIAMHGLKRRSLFGLALAGYGSWMAYTAMQGQTPSLSKLMDKLSSFGGQAGGQGPSYQHDYKSQPSQQRPADDVDEAAMESFPASDPPARRAESTPAQST